MRILRRHDEKRRLDSTRISGGERSMEDPLAIIDGWQPLVALLIFSVHCCCSSLGFDHRIRVGPRLTDVHCCSFMALTLTLRVGTWIRARIPRITRRLRSAVADAALLLFLVSLFCCGVSPFRLVPVLSWVTGGEHAGNNRGLRESEDGDES
jgi:hypothetical protein